MDETSVRQRGGIHWQRPGRRQPTYQRFVGTLEHITDVLAQPRLQRLPADEAKVIHMLYPLHEGKETQAALMGMRSAHRRNFYTFRSPQISPSWQGHRRRSVTAGSQNTYPFVQQIKGDIHSDPLLSDEKKNATVIQFL